MFYYYLKFIVDDIKNYHKNNTSLNNTIELNNYILNLLTKKKLHGGSNTYIDKVLDKTYTEIDRLKNQKNELNLNDLKQKIINAVDIIKNLIEFINILEKRSINEKDLPKLNEQLAQIKDILKTYI